MNQSRLPLVLSLLGWLVLGQGVGTMISRWWQDESFGLLGSFNRTSNAPWWVGAIIAVVGGLLILAGDRLAKANAV